MRNSNGRTVGQAHRTRRRVALLAAALMGSMAYPVAADDPGFAPCARVTPPSNNAPSSTVVVSILSIKPNSDLEGDDDHVPFYDNHADIYGFVTIAGETFSLPKVEENDFPHWDTNGVFRKTVAGGPVHIAISIKESDGGLTGDDDTVDVSPVAGKNILDLDYDLCSLRISGDIGDVLGQTQNVITVPAGSDSNDATIRFKVELEDGRPVTADDLALVDVDFVQVVNHQANIVAGKPTILRVRLASNYSTDVSTSLRVVIQGGIAVDQTFPVTIGHGEVKKFDFFTDTPLIFPASGAPYVPFVRVSVVDPNSAPPGDCRHDNDEFVSGSGPIILTPDLRRAGPALPSTEAFWQVVATASPHILWTPVGTLLDIGNCAGDSSVGKNRDLGAAFIKGTYPVAEVHSTTNPICVIPPASAAFDFLATVLAAFGLPADAVLPFVLVFDLNGLAAQMALEPVFGVDRVIGILPNNWFDRFIDAAIIGDPWAEVTGLSLGEFAPHAVILMASSDGDPMMTLPAHELGHTYGLSVATEIKSWVCGQDFPGDIDVLACGATGGFDEYKSELPIPGITKGKPSNGYWTPQGGEPASLPGTVFGEQCDSHCLMGGSPRDAENNWASRKRWVDTADYDQVLRKLSSSPLFSARTRRPGLRPPLTAESIFVSGMIAHDDRVYLGPWYRAPGVPPDRTDAFGLYSLRFKDALGQTLGEVGIPIDWNTPDMRGGVPITFFGLFVPYAAGTDHIDVVNTQTAEVLATQEVSPNAPEVHITAPTPGQVVTGGCAVRIAWQASDADGGPLAFTVLVKPAVGNGFPAAYGLTAREYLLDVKALPPGEYTVTVMAADGVNVGKSQPVTFTLGPPGSPDTAPPTIDVNLNHYVLWPPNHKMWDIAATVDVHDACDPSARFVLTSITSDEPDDGRGDGSTHGDIQRAAFGTADVAFQLRAERAGGGNGRTYTITYTALDGSGNTATDVVYVTVPRNRKGHAAVKSVRTRAR